MLISNIQIISNAYEPDSSAPEINKNIVSSSARSDVTVKSINPVRYRKENVRKSTEYSPYKRASKSYGRGFTISVDRSVSFSVTASGADGLYSLGATVSHKESATRTNKKYKMAYIGCRCRYSVERGTRVVYNAMNGKILGKNPYVVKKPVSYQYELCPDR
ncbi:hypothetical protein [Peptostreptococcus anaerobius]|uniref:hypothetical protein n=1 Tax=Peptostreptococcus anaerobius TaxID=1261 RepID=UPI0024323F77|nr:hypothetical protein [Peptostreptococcus anaerobius]